MPEAAVLTDPFTDMVGKLTTFIKALTTKTPIAQTPKELIWTLNKAKLYRYVPVVPEEAREPAPGKTPDGSGAVVHGVRARAHRVGGW